MHPHSPTNKKQQGTSSFSPLQKRNFPETARSATNNERDDKKTENNQSSSTALVVVDNNNKAVVAVSSPSSSPKNNNQQQKSSTTIPTGSIMKIPQNLPALSCWPAKPKNVNSNNNDQNSRSLALFSGNNDINSSPTAMIGGGHLDDEGTTTISLTSSKPALAIQLEKELSLKLSSKKSLPERVTIVSDLLKKFAKMFPSYQSVMHAAIDVIHGFSGELSKEVVCAKDVAVASVREFQRSELRDAHALLIKEAEKRVALEAEVQALKGVIAKKIKDRENEVQIAHNETMKLIRRTHDEAHMEDEVKRLRLHVGQLATECAKLKLEVHRYEIEKNKGAVRRSTRKVKKVKNAGENNTNNGDDANEENCEEEEEEVYHHVVRDIRDTLPPAFIEASRHELEKSRMVMQREIIECAAGTNSAFRLKIGHLQRQVEELQAKLKESENQREMIERLSYERRYIRGTLPVDVFDAIKRDGLAKADEPLPRLREDFNHQNQSVSFPGDETNQNSKNNKFDDFISPQEIMRRDELSAISSCYTPRPFISYDVQTVLGISLNGRTRDVVEQLAIVAVDLYEELLEIKKNNRKLYAAARWMSAQELDRLFEQDKDDAEKEQREKNKVVRALIKNNNNNNNNKIDDTTNKNNSKSNDADDDQTNAENQTNGFSLFDEDDQDRKDAKKREKNGVTPPPNVSPPLTSLSLLQKMSSGSNNNNNNENQKSASSPTSKTRVDGIIPTYSEREWPSIPHFLRTDISLGILSKNWSAKETINFSIQILGLLPEATERARRLKDKFMIKPPADVLTERRRSHLLPPLDATNNDMIGHQQKNLESNSSIIIKPFVPIGYAATIALRMVAEKQLLYEWEEQNANLMRQMRAAKQRSDDETFAAQTQMSMAASHLLGLNGSNTQFASQTNFDKMMMMSASKFQESFAASIHQNNNNGGSQQREFMNTNGGVEKIVNRSAIIRLATDYSYNWWDALHHYQETEPLCRLMIKILDGSMSLGVFDFYKKFMTQLHQELARPSANQHVQSQITEILSTKTKSNINNGDGGNLEDIVIDEDKINNNNDNANKNTNTLISSSAPTTSSPLQLQDNALIWPEFAKRLAWRFSGSPIENLSRKAVFAAALTVEFLHLSFADRLPVSKMLSLDVLLPSPASYTSGNNLNNSNKNNNATGDSSSPSSSQATTKVSPLANALLSITLDAMQELFHLVYQKLEPCVKQSSYAEGVSVLNAGDALALAKEIDAGFLATKQTDFVKKIYEKIAKHASLNNKNNKDNNNDNNLSTNNSSSTSKNGKQQQQGNNNNNLKSSRKGVPSSSEGVKFAENLEIHQNETHNVERQQEEEEVEIEEESSTPESIQNFLLLQASSVSSLSFCARMYVKTALQMCMKLDGTIHKPRDKKMFSHLQVTTPQSSDAMELSLNSPTSNSNNSRKNRASSAASTTTSPSNNNKQKKSTASSGVPSRSTQNVSKNSDRSNKNKNTSGNNNNNDDGDDTALLTTPEATEHFGEFQTSPSAILNDIIQPGNNNNNKHKRRRRSSVKALSNGQLTSTELMNDMLFSGENAPHQQQHQTTDFFGDDLQNNNNKNNQNNYQEAASRSLYTEEEAAAAQEVDGKMWVEWHEFISKLRRITPKSFSAEEILTHHSNISSM